jgi:hypothetical protein
MASDSISSESKELETALRDLGPAALDADFLARLEAAAAGTLTELSDAELRFEKSLHDRAPAPLSADFMHQLERIVADVPFPVNEKIVLFPKSAAAARPAAKNRRPMWAAAAAVALIGGLSALMLPAGKPAATTVKNSGASPANPVANSRFVPAGFNSVADTEDVGISWHQAGQPHRVLRLTYRDRVTLKNAEGKTIEVEQPRTEYILVPEKMD